MGENWSWRDKLSVLAQSHLFPSLPPLACLWVALATS
jgi:hypothetical protein